MGYNSTGLVEGLAHQTHLQHVSDDGKEATFAPPTLPCCPSHLNPLPHTHQTHSTIPLCYSIYQHNAKEIYPTLKMGQPLHKTSGHLLLTQTLHTTVPDTPSRASCGFTQSCESTHRGGVPWPSSSHRTHCHTDSSCMVSFTCAECGESVNTTQCTLPNTCMYWHMTVGTHTTHTHTHTHFWQTFSLLRPRYKNKEERSH